MEDTRQDGIDPDPDALAGIEPEGTDDTAVEPDGGDIPGSGESDEIAEPAPSDELDVPDPEPDAGDEPDVDEAGKVIPYGRFRDVVEQRNDLKEQNQTLLTILKQQGISLDGSKVTKEEKANAEVDLSKYSPKQIANAKALLGTVLKEELGVVGTLAEQVASLKKTQEDKQREEAQKQRTEAEQEDARQMESAIKEFKGAFKKEEVNAQILKWDSSANSQLKALARAPYSVILREMQRMKGARKAKAPPAAPKPPASSGGDGNDGLPAPKRDPKRIRPTPGDPTAWAHKLAMDATRKMASEAEAGE